MPCELRNTIFEEGWDKNPPTYLVNNRTIMYIIGLSDGVPRNVTESDDFICFLSFLAKENFDYLTYPSFVWA